MNNITKAIIEGGYKMSLKVKKRSNLCKYFSSL